MRGVCAGIALLVSGIQLPARLCFWQSLFGDSVGFLDFTERPVASAVNDVQVAMGHPAPMLLEATFGLFPVAFNAIPIHLRLLEYLKVTVTPTATQPRWLEPDCSIERASFKLSFKNNYLYDFLGLGWNVICCRAGTAGRDDGHLLKKGVVVVERQSGHLP